MKPVAFDYRRATSVAEACAMLAGNPAALLIAGGQSLMPMLAMRLARPTLVVDILRIPELDRIELMEHHITFGATTRQVTVERSRTVAESLPLLARAMPWIGHPPTRRRGTVGGSIANADPTAEIALVAVALGAEVLLAGTPGGAASVRAEDFFLGPMVTALPPGAMITGLRFARRADRRGVGTGFVEVAQRHGDYALAAAAAEIALDAAGHCRALHLGVGGATVTPVRLDLAALLGRRLAEPEVTAAVAAAIAPMDMLEDQHASGRYRRRAAQALAVRAVLQACDDARGRT
jgi:CO/xanthine dehydrogenase FAD-binding subunit